MKTKKQTNKKERISGLVVTSLLFLTLCSLSIFLLVNNNRDVFGGSDKGQIKTKMEKLQSFREIQAAESGNLQHVYERIGKFAPGINSSYEENEIMALVSGMQGLYGGANDPRYKVFVHAAMLCEMWFADRKEIWVKRQNISFLRANLDQCEMGLGKEGE